MLSWLEHYHAWMRGGDGDVKRRRRVRSRRTARESMHENDCSPLVFALAGCRLFAALAQFDHSHAAWTALLKKHVVLIDGGKASQVRYADSRRTARSSRAISTRLSKVSEAEFDGWTQGAAAWPS